MALFSITSPFQQRSAPSLHRRFIVGAGFAGVASVLLLALSATTLMDRNVEQQGNARIADAAGRALIVLNGELDDRARQAKVLVLSPEVIAAAQEGGAKARALGIVGAEISTLETRFNADRSMLVAPGTRLYLRSLLSELDAAEMLLTDANGYNAVITERSSDFVQSDESWWQLAWRDGLSPADAAFDSSANQTVVSLAATIRSGAVKVGVLKLAFSVASLAQALSSAGAGVRVDVLDSVDRVLLSSAPGAVGQTLHGMPSGLLDHQVVSAMSNSVDERASALRANAGRWRVVAHLPSASIATSFRAMRIGIVAAAAALLLVLAGLLIAMSSFLHHRITQPATELAEAAEAVAAGDFTVQLRHASSDDEIGRLSRAVGAMIVELRRLAEAIATSARETNAMSTEITAGSEEMAATAGEIANTASDLSVQATSMAETIATLASSASALQMVAFNLDDGAREGVTRNAALRTLARENRAGLDASAESLGTLAGDVHASAEAIVALGAASEEIRSFVTLVRKLARQSKLLALNAAMEAARAGAHGAGFAVVAGEVRRLAAMSSDAAERTESIVNSVLKGVSHSRESAERAVITAEDVRVATSRATDSFSEIERAVSDAEVWTTVIERASAETSALVGEMTVRLGVLAGGTDSFAAAMQQVAASSEEQSASTQEIAGSANALGTAAEKLSKLVAGLKHA